MTGVDLFAPAVRALAASLRSGVAPRRALLDWHRHTPAPLRPPVKRVARRLRLGATSVEALETLRGVFGEEAAGLVTVFEIQDRLGGDLATMLDRLAESVEARRLMEASAAAAGAGALLSARVVAGLPLLLIPLTPLARAPLWDPTGLVLLIAGAGLALGGLAWIGRLVPRPPGPDGVAVVADVTSCALEGGAPLPAALEAVAGGSPSDLRALMMRAGRRVRLGLSWPEALAVSGDHGLAALGECLRRTDELGAPAARSLGEFASRRREERRREFETSLRRAPVLMVIPLSFCVLPAYGLLGLGPYLRGLSLGAG